MRRAWAPPNMGLVATGHGHGGLVDAGAWAPPPQRLSVRRVRKVSGGVSDGSLAVCAVLTCSPPGEKYFSHANPTRTHGGVGPIHSPARRLLPPDPHPTRAINRRRERIPEATPVQNHTRRTLPFSLSRSFVRSLYPPRIKARSRSGGRRR